MGSFPPPAPFRVETNEEATGWLDALLFPPDPSPPTVGFIVPSGYEAYARLLHPGRRRFLDRSADQRIPLRWSEIAAARGKSMHPEVGLPALLDNRDTEDYDYWKAISTGGGQWFPPYEWLEETEALALVSLLRPFTAATEDAWFMLWDGYGDFGMIDGVPRGTIHRVPEPPDAPAELVGDTLAFRHYLIFRGPLDALSTWFDWRTEGPNYLWPDDQAWIVATEIDGFSTYVGGSKQSVDQVLASPLLEAFPCTLTDRFDGLGDPINGPI